LGAKTSTPSDWIPITDPHRRREMRAHVIWSEAIDRISPVLREKGIVA
jgi:hypothetical protein